jgi:beta-glucosidase
MGEDPYLASRMVVPYIQGVQSNGVAACVKHFALNNQEIARHTVNVEVSDRALYEIYLPAFKAAVQEGKAWAIMGAYNLYKGQHACHNQYLLNDILRGEWKFDGVVVSDWGGVYSTEQSAYNGLDMEFGTWTDGLTEGKSFAYDDYFLAKPFLKLLQSKKIDEEVVNNKVRNILRLVFRTNMNTKRPWGSFGTEEHALTGRKVAQEGIVLLQNKNDVLPLDLSKVKKIAVIGENAIKVMIVGGGSSSLKSKYEISPLKGIKNRIGSSAEVIYARGYAGAKSGPQDGLDTGQDITETRSANDLISEACAAAKEADAVIFVGGLNKNNGQDCESDDREGLGLPYGQDKLISELSKANKNLVVVLISGNAVAMPWVKEVPAILQSWYLGSEAGNAIASVITGDINPSGKLPMTFAEKLNDYASHSLGEYPGDSLNVKYNDDIYVGYRWLDKEKIKPLFPFGHGLSYTKFNYGKAAISSKTMGQNDKVSVSVAVKNIGKTEGKEVVQLYIGDEKASVARPVKELKAFDKINLLPGEEKQVNFTISIDDLKFYDENKKDWVAEPGKFNVYIGSSSTDIRSIVDFELK